MSFLKLAMGPIISRSKALPSSLLSYLSSLLSSPPLQAQPLLHPLQQFLTPQIGLSSFRSYHDGGPRGPLWRGKKMIGKEALFVVLGLKRFKDSDEKLEKFVKTHVLRLLKLDMITVLNELERQQ